MTNQRLEFVSNLWMTSLWGHKSANCLKIDNWGEMTNCSLYIRWHQVFNILEKSCERRSPSLYSPWGKHANSRQEELSWDLTRAFYHRATMQPPAKDVFSYNLFKCYNGPGHSVPWTGLFFSNSALLLEKLSLRLPTSKRIQSEHTTLKELVLSWPDKTAAGDLHNENSFNTLKEFER